MNFRGGWFYPPFTITYCPKGLLKGCNTSNLFSYILTLKAINVIIYTAMYTVPYTDTVKSFWTHTVYTQLDSSYLTGGEFTQPMCSGTLQKIV